MKRKIIKIVSCIFLLLSIIVGYLFFSFSSQVGSEYGAAGAVGDLRDFIESNKRWPKGPEELYPNGSPEAGVYIDYEVTLDEIIADPSKLRQSVGTESGQFSIYPHFDRNVEDLLKFIQDQARENQE